MEKKLDLRIQKTYKALIDTLMQLLSEKDFEDITVNELCDRAMVRRSTFYKHFGDKYELLAFMIRELQRKFDEENKTYSSSEEIKTYCTEIVRYILDFLEQNKKIFNIFKKNMSPILINIISEQIESDLEIRFKEFEKRGAVLSASAELMAPLFTGALVYISKWWIMQQYKMPKEEIIEQFSDLVDRL
jgi:AcrR family transcriptional regulator